MAVMRLTKCGPESRSHMSTRTPINFTQRFVDTVKPPAKDSASYQDSQVKGLNLRVRSTGLKTWVVRYRWEGAERMVTQPVDYLKLDDARKWAHSVKGDVSRDDPPHLRGTVSPVKKAKTIEELGNEVLAYLKDQGRSKAYLEASKRYHDKVIVPAIGHIEANKLTSADVDAILRPLTSKAATHNRVLSWITKMLNQGRRWSVVFYNWHYDLERQAESAREAFLNDAQLTRLMGVFKSGASDHSIVFLALTGARPAEAFRARWDQIDLQAQEWRKPAANVKNRTAHAVPLAPEAVELLQSIQRATDAEETAAAAITDPAKREAKMVSVRKAREWVFPSPRGGKVAHLTTVKKRWATLCQEAKLEDVELYDLRKTFATRLMSQGASVRTVQSLTGHKTASVLLKHYAQVVGDDQRRAVAGLMQRPAAATP
jgi:integrase